MQNKIFMLPVLREMGGIFHKYGFSLYTVGGYVRNSLLGLPVTDFDVCSSALPEQVIELLNEEGISVIEKAVKFGTVEIHYVMDGKKYTFEHTTFRKDFYDKGGSHRPKHVIFTQEIADDALRRDFTINALYAQTQTGEVLDITKRGINDLQKGIIAAAHIDPFETIKDDGLRLMRLVRFACELGFSIDLNLYLTAKNNAKLLCDISGERINTELKKIILSDTSYKIENKCIKPHREGMVLLNKLGLLEHIFPSLFNCAGVLQKEQFHAYDVLTHCIEAYAVIKPDLSLRLAALLHDIGKSFAIKINGNMNDHEIFGAELAKRELSALRFDKNTIDTAAVLIKNHMFDLLNEAKPSTVRKKAAALGHSMFSKLIELRRADFIGSGKPLDTVESADKWQSILDEMTAKNTPFHENDLNITGKDVMRILNIQEGKTIGLIKKRLLDICIQKPSQNNFKNLINHAKNIYKEISKQNK